MNRFIIEEYDTTNIVISTEDISKLKSKIKELKKDGLSNYRISEEEEVYGHNEQIMVMNLDEFDEITHLVNTL